LVLGGGESGGRLLKPRCGRRHILFKPWDGLVLGSGKGEGSVLEPWSRVRHVILNSWDGLVFSNDKGGGSSSQDVEGGTSCSSHRIAWFLAVAKVEASTLSQDAEEGTFCSSYGA
jgi:hypothetical protein